MDAGPVALPRLSRGHRVPEGQESSQGCGHSDPDGHGPGIPCHGQALDRFSPEEVSTHVAKAKGRRQFEDTLGTCIFCIRVPLRLVLDAFNAVTGWDFTPKEAQDMGFRAANLMRAFNLRHGVSIETERPSPRWASAPVDGPAKGISISPHWDSMLDNYYNLMGWDRKTGRPFPETLKALGLAHVIADLWG